MSEKRLKTSGEQGFSLLEVVITLAILVTIIFSISNLLRSTIDVKLSLSQKNRITQRMNRAMQQVTDDLAHVYVLDAKDYSRNGDTKRTLFRLKRNEANGDLLEMTYMNHHALKANSKESDYSFVVYELRESKKYPHRKNLYRGELPRIPEKGFRFKEKPDMKLFVPNVQKLSFEPWTGDGWSKSGWDSHGKETENKIPQMVRVSMTFWEEDPIEGMEPSHDDDELVISLSTIVGLPYSLDMKEIKSRKSSLDLSKLN